MPDIAATPEPWTIEPRPSGVISRVTEVWRYRRMFRFFAERAVRKLYQRTVLGAAWIVLRPLIPLLVRLFVFGGLLGIGSGSSRVPYFLFLAVGGAAWDLFAGSVMWATRSLELNGGILSRLYVPRLILPIASIVPALIGFAINVAVVIGAFIYYRVQDGVWYLDTTWLIVAPVSLVLMLLVAWAIGMFTSVLGAQARDVRFGLGYVLEFWIFLTPVMYPLTIVPGGVQWAMMLNPMAVLVVAFRGAILGGEGPTPVEWLTALAIVAVVLSAGLVFFHKAEAEAVDNL